MLVVALLIATDGPFGDVIRYGCLVIMEYVCTFLIFEILDDWECLLLCSSRTMFMADKEP